MFGHVQLPCFPKQIRSLLLCAPCFLFYYTVFVVCASIEGRGGGLRCQNPFLVLPVQQTTSGISHRVSTFGSDSNDQQPTLYLD